MKNSKLLAVAALLALAGCRSPNANQPSSALRADAAADAATPAADAMSGVGASGPAAQSAFEKNKEAIIYALKSGLLTSMYAKEVCSCVFLTKLDHKTCIARTNMYVTALAVTAEIDTVKKRVKGIGKAAETKELAAQYLPGVDPTTLNPPFEAEFREGQPHLGCRIVTEPKIMANDGGAP